MSGELAGRWAIDPWHSSVAFTCQVNTMSSLDGRFDAFEGEVTFAPDGGGRAHGAVQTASVDTNLDQRDDILRGPETLGAEAHPQLTFTADELVRGDAGSLEVRGRLTMRGVTMPVELAGRLEGPIVDVLGIERIGLDLTGAVSYSAFGIGGLPVVGDRIALRLGLQAVRGEAG